MLEVRFHGRGGQGAVTSAELVAQAAIAEDRFAQAFPSFGPERRGAPVVAYLRLSDHQIRNRTAIQEPNVVIVLDPALPGIVPVDAGLQEGGIAIINSNKDPEALRREFGLECKLAVVNANRVAREEIGRVITNTTMLGAFLKATGCVRRETLAQMIHNRFGAIAERNINAFRRAFDETVISEAVAPGSYPKPQKKAGAEIVTPDGKPRQSVMATWQELNLASTTHSGSARYFLTGDWRSSRPVWVYAGKDTGCVACGVCTIYCPEGCLSMVPIAQTPFGLKQLQQFQPEHLDAESVVPMADLNYCKGCGICAQECWTRCIKMVTEES